MAIVAKDIGIVSRQKREQLITGKTAL